MPEAHQILFPKTAHYYTHGTPSKQVKYFWIACHGYGQLASKFIHKFDGLDPIENLVLAPEGMSRFYWNNDNQQVGASWMTRKDRLDEIADYTRFIKLLFQQYLSECDENVEIILFGFSQGCATQIRWIMREFPKFHHLILWGGLLPEDLDYLPHTDYFLNKKMYWVYGKEDQFLKEKIINWHYKFMKEQSLNFKTISFEGKHVVDRTILNDLFSEIKTRKLF